MPTIQEIANALQGSPRTPAEVDAFETGQVAGFSLFDINTPEVRALIDDLDPNLREAFIEGYEHGYCKADKT